MGYLQRFFSIRSRRFKKSMGVDADTYDVPPVPDLQRQHEAQEETVSSLLRSSSARFAVMREVDYASLPPIPHPIYHVLPTPTASTSNLASVSQRGTYTVKVLPRTIHSRTEFPNANPDESITPKRPRYESLRHRSKSVPITPRDKIRLLDLRQDPSVVSLLEMYDDHGCLDSKVFSNSPISPDNDNEGRSQIRRGGSTLRQLLGDPSSQSSRHARNNSAAEGDISWAERCLCESADSSTSSLGVQTPSDALFPDAHFTNGHNNDMTPNSHDTTINDSDPHPAFSSLEVELSMVTEDLPASNNSNSNYSYPNDIPMIPQRASQVFGFLTAKSQTRHQSQNNPKERPRPALPATVQALTSRFSSYSSSAGSHESNISSSDDTHIHEIESTIPSGYNQASPKWPSESNWLERPPSGMRNQTISTTISYNKLAASPNVQQVVTSAPEAQISRLPRGPRALPQSHSNSTQPNPSEKQVHLDFNSLRQVPRRAFEYTPRSNITTASASNLLASNNIDAFTSIPSRPSHRRTPRSSTALTLASSNHEKSDLRYVAPTAVKPIQPQELKEMSPVHDKENENEGAVLYKAPMTPVRSRSVFRAPNGVTPSPASSSDLSPVAQQLMADLRTQRMHARERQKRNGRWGSTTSKLKW